MDWVNTSGITSCYRDEIRFDGFGEIGHDYLMIRSNLGALSVGFMGSLKLQCLCRSWLFPEVKFVTLFCRLIIVY
jgi:hypothetical protein